MKRVNHFYLTVLATAILACTTTDSSTVLERADDLKSRPEWASVTNSTFDEKDKSFFVGYIEVEGDSSKSAALNMADEKAMSEPMRSLVDQFLDQNQVGEELRKDAVVGQRVISATRGYRPPMAGLKVVKRYWETVRVPGVTPDSARIELRAFSLAELPKSDYEAAKKEYFARLRKEPAVKKILEDVGAKQRDNVLNQSKDDTKDSATE